MADSVVLVHGLWFRARFMGMLARRLEAGGLAVHLFDYRTTREPLERSAARLHEFCGQRAPAGGHLLGHSLGGLLILHMLQHCPAPGPGRLLFLGTPLLGSATARRARSWPGGSRLLGHAGARLSEGPGHWPQDRETGMVAGTRAFGLGMLSGGLPRPNDGTVAVAETRHPALCDLIELLVSHTGMLYSPEVARQALHFLERGRFRRRG